MNQLIRNIILSLLLLLKGIIISAESNGYTLSGYIRDGSNGEALIGAGVFVKENKKGTVTNNYGYFSLTLPDGHYNIEFSFIGYRTITHNFHLNKNQTFNIDLKLSTQELQEVIVTANRLPDNVLKTEMNTMKIDMKTIKAIPAMAGEIDPIRVVQLLPGVTMVSEGSTGYSVRGGAIDQNLILLDEAPVFNPSHLLGFLSVFNNDAIKNVKLYKAGIPSQYGSRLSSLLDVHMRDGNSKKFSGTGGIGFITSRLTLEGPINKGKGSFIISGRRAYIDVYKLFSSDKSLNGSDFYFYDLNLKANYTLGIKDNLYISGYLGRDVIKFSGSDINWGNKTLTIRWNHLFSNRIFCNTSFIFSNYNYTLGTDNSATTLEWVSGIKEYSFKHDYSFYLNPNNTIRYGLQSTFHTFVPGKIEAVGFINSKQIQNSKALENALYVSNEQKIGNHLTLEYGLRYSIFTNFGTNDNSQLDLYSYYKDSLTNVQYKFPITYAGLDGIEPRVGIHYMMDSASSIKFSYTRTRQFVHLASNAVIGIPLDIWVPSSPIIKPQRGDQYALGYFRYFGNHKIETSVEVFYKDMKHQIDFKDFASLLLNTRIENEFRFGTAKAYGIEFLIRKQMGNFQGWISYTYSRVKRYFPEINNGKPYSAPYDKPHCISIVLMYAVSKRIELSSTWVYSTGSAITLPSGKFEFSGDVAGIVTERNSYRLPDYHRLDLGILIKQKEKADRKFFSEWNFSIYNAYNRKNAWMIDIKPDVNNLNKMKAVMIYLFPIIPSVSWTFRF